MKKIVLSFPLILILISFVYILTSCGSDSDDFVIGFTETTVIDVASEIPGRVEKILVERGDTVKEGDTLALFEPKILDAKVGQAQGIKHAARSLKDMAKNGARKQEIEAAKNAYLITKSQFEYVEKTWKRMKKLLADSVISQQKFDEIQFKYNAAKNQMYAAKAVYEMAKEGARKEAINIAIGEYEAAENLFNEAMAYRDELALRAPVSGEISNQMADKGEVIAAGYPLVSIQVPEDTHVIVQIREDKMKPFKKGKKFTVAIPALDNEEYTFVVSYISPMADFANWLPTNDKGQIDLRTFEVHLKPKEQIEDLRPGMTVKVLL